MTSSEYEAAKTKAITASRNSAYLAEQDDCSSAVEAALDAAYELAQYSETHPKLRQILDRYYYNERSY